MMSGWSNQESFALGYSWVVFVYDKTNQRKARTETLDIPRTGSGETDGPFQG